MSVVVVSFALLLYLLFLFPMLSLHMISPLFPYTTLFRSYHSCSSKLPTLKNEYEWLKEVDSTALQSSLQNLADSFLRFFKKRSEEHTSELQSRGHLVCRLLLEKKKKQINYE